MWETLLALAVFILFAAIAWVNQFVPWLALLRGGVVTIVLGTLSSVIAGAFYHIALYRVLQPRSALPPRWWLNPTGLHPLLNEGDKPRVLPWFYVGATAFLLVILGCGAVLLAVFAGERAG